MASLLDAAPEELQALRQIAMLRAAGYSDQDIFSRMANVQAGGYGLLPYVTDLAGITSNYALGRGNLAQGQQQLYYDQVRNPYNVVSATQYMRDTAASPFLTDPVLGQVQASPAARYSQYIDSILFPPGESGMTGATPQTLAQPGVPNAAGQSWIDAWRAYHPGQPDPVAGYAVNAQNTGAQQAAARNLGATLPGMQSPHFGATLARGGVPGLSSLNEAEIGRLTPDQRAQWLGLIQSTGLTSDANAAYDAFAERYRTRGAQAAGTYR